MIYQGGRKRKEEKDIIKNEKQLTLYVTPAPGKVNSIVFNASIRSTP